MADNQKNFLVKLLKEGKREDAHRLIVNTPWTYDAAIIDFAEFDGLRVR